jgi:UDP-3-O-[3-hydroxymyristoyl] N-acetylglucosamine deacetylase
MDGSSAPFVDAIDQVGIVAINASRRYLKVLKPVRVNQGKAFAELLPNERGFRLDVEITSRPRWSAASAAAVDLSAAAFRRDVSRARTFGFMRDVETLWAAGFALGASLDNTVAIGDDGVINPEGLRYADEFVRHKLLDAIGDLSLAGLRCSAPTAPIAAATASTSRSSRPCSPAGRTTPSSRPARAGSRATPRSATASRCRPSRPTFTSS